MLLLCQDLMARLTENAPNESNEDSQGNIDMYRAVSLPYLCKRYAVVVTAEGTAMNDSMNTKDVSVHN